MLNLKPHHRVHIPNTLAVLAAVMLLLSSFTGHNTSQKSFSTDADPLPSAKIENSENDKLNDSTEYKRRGLNLGMLLFRRG